MHLEMRVDSFHLETMLDEQDQCNVKLALQIFQIFFYYICVKICLNVIHNFCNALEKDENNGLLKEDFYESC